MHGERTVSIFQLDGITRNKTVYKRVASMLSRDHNWTLFTNRHEFKVVVRTQSKWIDPVSYEVDRGVKSMWIESRSSADRP